MGAYWPVALPMAHPTKTHHAHQNTTITQQMTPPPLRQTTMDTQDTTLTATGSTGNQQTGPPASASNTSNTPTRHPPQYLRPRSQLQCWPPPHISSALGSDQDVYLFSHLARAPLPRYQLYSGTTSAKSTKSGFHGVAFCANLGARLAHAKLKRSKLAP